MKLKTFLLFLCLLFWQNGFRLTAQNARNPFDINQPSLRVFLPAPELAPDVLLSLAPVGDIVG
ncbi:hypothetical protein GGR06_003399 [Bacteroides reticulotermitis]|uniref:ABC transporter substrate-binding protein n=2 Tax=Bacteroides reticulotermitis TaxID=1133319 RepID=W4UV40_9BACE|nr:hypothetical protein [Bacteroides reticulotermitis]GAE84443.1 hypothetical protein JCM10512_2788 [Bacteroides reticulotermitis JCM 10512]